jgi:hypothetical protein
LTRRTQHNGELHDFCYPPNIYDRMTGVCGTCGGGERCLGACDGETEGKMPLR